MNLYFLQAGQVLCPMDYRAGYVILLSVIWEKGKYHWPFFVQNRTANVMGRMDKFASS